MRTRREAPVLENFFTVSDQKLNLTQFGFFCSNYKILNGNFSNQYYF